MNSARWEHFNPHPDDIIITTSYKAGTIWLQGICAALVFQQPQPPVPQDDPKLSLVIMLITGGLSALFAKPIAAAMVDDPDVIALTAQFLVALATYTLTGAQ